MDKELTSLQLEPCTENLNDWKFTTDIFQVLFKQYSYIASAAALACDETFLFDIN
jgi:hypothetical protein